MHHAPNRNACLLQGAHGPVIIDLPQAVNAAANNSAKDMLLCDVENITLYYARFAPELADSHYAEEIWELYEKGELKPDLKLTGKFEFSTEAADVVAVLRFIDVAYEGNGTAGTHARQLIRKKLQRETQMDDDIGKSLS